LAAGLLALPASPLWAAEPNVSVKSVELLSDQTTVTNHFRKLGYRAHGGVERSASERIESEHRTFPTFSSSFTVGGVTYPFTMIGHPPTSGRPAFIKSVIIPLWMNFVGFPPNQSTNHTFESAPRGDQRRELSALRPDVLAWRLLRAVRGLDAAGGFLEPDGSRSRVARADGWPAYCPRSTSK
jgi:hypothetical protein